MAAAYNNPLKRLLSYVYRMANALEIQDSRESVRLALLSHRFFILILKNGACSRFDDVYQLSKSFSARFVISVACIKFLFT